MKLYNLIKRHYAKTPGFDINKYIEKLHNADNYDTNNINCYKLDQILPTSQLIAKENDFNVVYHGRECEAETIQLWKYDQYYILLEFDGDGDDLSVYNIVEQCGDIRTFYDKCFIVYKLDQFDKNIFLNKVGELSTIIKFFRNFYELKEEGLVEYEKYMREKYAENDID